jgi:Transposase DDE domain
MRKKPNRSERPYVYTQIASSLTYCYLCLMAKSKSPLGDVRLARAFNKFIHLMSEKMTVVLRQLGELRRDEVSFGRFINNPKVTPNGIIQQYWLDHPIDWHGKHLLVIEDGSTISFNSTPNRKDLGRIGSSDRTVGFEIHNSLLLDANDFSCYGVGSVQINKTEHRSDEENKLRRAAYRTTLIEDKETFRWYSTAEDTIKNCPKASSYTIIADQESDIYEIITKFGSQGWDFVVRCTDERRVEYKGKTSLLKDVLSSWKIEHAYELPVVKTKNRSAHTAKLEVKFGTVELLRPKDSPNKTIAPKYSVQIVEISEHPSTVCEGEDPIHWVLVTSHPVETIEQAMLIVRWYCARWNIEQMYRTIKLEGLDVEHSEAESHHSLSNLAVLSLLAAVKVMTLLRARNGQTQQEMTSMFEPKEIEFIQLLNPTVEGDTEKQKNPHPPHSLAFATWVIARLGGWDVYNKTRPPGPITILNGLVRFQTLFRGFSLKV